MVTSLTFSLSVCVYDLREKHCDIGGENLTVSKEMWDLFPLFALKFV